MAKNEGTPKIGAGHADAMFRQGLSELRGALYADSNVAQPPQYGLYGTKTPSEVADAKQADLAAPASERESVLASKLPEVEPAAEAPQPQHERE